MSDSQDDFFVGYFKMSPSGARYAIAVGVGALILGLGIGVGVVLTQENPGPGLKPQASGTEFEGVVLATPYPHMRYLDENDQIQTLLFVSSGKFGIEAPSPREGLLRAKGTLFERDQGRLMAGPSFEPLEDSEPRDSQANLEGRLRNHPEMSLGTTKLTGEIVDSKCYYGAMRPGGGRGHRSCAQMCISGGVPPILIVRHEGGEESHVLLCSLDESPVNQEVLPFVAEPVAIEGDLVRRAGILILKFDPHAIKRL